MASIKLRTVFPCSHPTVFEKVAELSAALRLQILLMLRKHVVQTRPIKKVNISMYSWYRVPVKDLNLQGVWRSSGIYGGMQNCENRSTGSG